MSSVGRLAVIQDHINPNFPEVPHDPTLDNYRRTGPEISKEILARSYFDISYSGITKYRNLMASSPLFNHEEQLGFSIEDYRGRIIEQLAYLRSKSDISFDTDKKDPSEKLHIIYPMAEYDLSLSTRFIVHIILYVDTLQNLGTEKHLGLINRAYSLKDYGCFGMTELGHGSNVAAVETTANYDPVSGGFVLNSPTPTSAKWWIGAAANTANVSVIFAQLIVEGVQKGVHAFAVPIRNYETHELFPGVFIGDCGKKIALDGIDNGFILFHNYSIPYDCLLDKFSQIREGKFKSLIKNKDKRLGVMMAGLIRGRFAVISGSEINARICLTIALRYSATRKQFGPSNELPIINYQLQKHRLIPALAKTIAIRCGIKGFLSMYINSKSKIDADPECDELNEIHSLLSSIKAVSSWMAIGIVQDCREACGGLGFSAYSSLGRYKSYQDIHTTWEGDNSVLIQQTGKYILKIVQKSFKGQKINPSTLSFLKFDLEEIKNFKAMFTRREDLENEKCLIELLEYRVNYLMHTSLLRLQENSVAALDITEAWNNSQIYHIQDLSKAYGELMMAKEFIKFYTVLSSECKETGDIMQKFFFLYCVDRIVNNISCYFDGAVTSSQERIVKDSILKLSSELAEVSVKIVDALSAPDSLIDSAIGSTDGQAYFNMIKSVQSKPIVYSKPKLLDLIRKVRVSTD